MQKFHGNWCTLLLPINQDQSIDFIALEEEIDILCGINPNGIYSNGTAGEFHNQSEDECDQIQQILAAQCHKAGVDFQIGASHSNPQICLERIAKYKSLKPNGFQIILPDWWVSSSQIAQNFIQMAAEEAGDIPLVLYHPPHGKSQLSLLELQMLFQDNPTLVGLKIAGGDDAWYENMRKYLKDVSVFIPGHHLITGLQQGAMGSYSNVACLNPDMAQKWYAQASSDLTGALELQERICQFMDMHMVPFIKAGYPNYAIDKAMAEIGGWGPVSCRVRLPYPSLPQEYMADLRKAAHHIIPEFITSF